MGQLFSVLDQGFSVLSCLAAHIAARRRPRFSVVDLQNGMTDTSLRFLATALTRVLAPARFRQTSRCEVGRACKEQLKL